MNRRKRFAVTIISMFVGGTLCVNGQNIIKTIGKRAEQKAKQRALNKADQAMDKTMDEVEKAVKKKARKDSTKSKTVQEAIPTPERSADTSMRPLFTAKYDFVPGEKVTVYEDFSRAQPGDFPAGWNTDASAEVVTVSGKEGKWLKIAKQGSFYPEMITEIPDNSTLEFYLIPGSKAHPAPFVLNFANLAKPEQFRNYSYNVVWKGQHAVQLQFWPGTEQNAGKASSQIVAGKTVNPLINSKTNFTTWDNFENTLAHVAIWRQATRLRVYVNGEKVWDLPRAFEASGKYNAITFAMPRSFKGDEYYLLSNIRLAVGASDTRNKLLTEGKLVTHGILFDSGSDRIKPESYGVLKEIAALFAEQSSLSVKVVGHTDSDGDEQSNLTLSRKRADAVKAALVNEFGVSAQQLATDGKGEAEPTEKGDSPKAKAANRRVEFIKQ